MTSIRGPGTRARRLLQPAGLLLAALVLAAGPPAIGRAAEKKALPTDLALVPPDSGLFVTIRVGDLASGKAGKALLTELSKDKDNLLTALERYLGVPLADVERLTILPGHEIAIVRTARPYDREKLLDALAPKAQRQKHKDHTYYHSAETGADVYLVDDRVFMRSQSREPGMGGLQRLWDRPAGKGTTLADALRLAAAKHDVVAGLTPAFLVEYFTLQEPGAAADVRPATGESPAKPPESRPKPPPPPDKEPGAVPAQLTSLPEQPQPREPSIDDLLRQLPPEALPYKPLFQARSATLVGDLGEEAKVEVRLTFADKDVAGDGETALRTALYVLRELLPRVSDELGVRPEKAKQVAAALGQTQTALKTATVTHEGTVVSATMHMEVEGTTIATLAQHLIEGGQRRGLENSLKQIVLATVNYADTYNGKMPAGIFDKAGKPLLSWRVAILPFIEQDQLYKEFHLDEPWDSDHNKKLIAKMPKVYAGLNARLNEQGKTVLLAPSGEGTAWPGGPDKMKYPASFSDGTANTILFVLADDAQAVEWTKPEDLKIDPKKPHAGLGQLAGRFVFGMADGSVHTTKTTISKETLWAAFTPAGNEILGADW